MINGEMMVIWYDDDVETDRGRYLKLTSGFYMCAPHILAHTCKLQGYEAEDPQGLEAAEIQSCGQATRKACRWGTCRGQSGNGTGGDAWPPEIPLQLQLGYTMTHSRHIYIWTHLWAVMGMYTEQCDSRISHVCISGCIWGFVKLCVVL